MRIFLSILLLLKCARGFQLLNYPMAQAPQGRNSVVTLQSTTTTSSSSSGGGMGMGMGMGSGKSKKSKSKDKTSKGMGNNNNSNKSSSSSSTKSTTPFDVNASLLRLEKKYEEIQQMSTRALHSDDSDSNEDSTGVASEMIVAVRASNSKMAATGDWVPFANLCVHPHAEVSSEWVHAAISLYCRELSLCATQGAKLFSAVPRNELQYAIEPMDSFFKHVYDPLIKDQQKGTDTPMTKAEARHLLELDLVNDGNDDDDEDNTIDSERARIRKSYRQKSFQWHPDRLDLANMSDEEQAHAAQQYARIQQAFGVLSSSVRSAGSSWYRSLGGRDRTDFQVIQELMARDTASAILERHKVQTAVAGLDPDLVQLFVARNQAIAASS